MVLPLSSDAVPFLGRGDDDVGFLYGFQRGTFRVACELFDPEGQSLENSLPCLLPLGAESFCWSHVDHLEGPVRVQVVKTTNGELEYGRFAAARGRCYDKIIVAFVRISKALGLHCVEKRKGENRAKSIRKLGHWDQLDSLNNRLVSRAEAMIRLVSRILCAQKR